MILKVIILKNEAVHNLFCRLLLDCYHGDVGSLQSTLVTLMTMKMFIIIIITTKTKTTMIITRIAIIIIK